MRGIHPPSGKFHGSGCQASRRRNFKPITCSDPTPGRWHQIEGDHAALNIATLLPPYGAARKNSTGCVDDDMRWPRNKDRRILGGSLPTPGLIILGTSS